MRIECQWMTVQVVFVQHHGGYRKMALLRLGY